MINNNERSDIVDNENNSMFTITTEELCDILKVNNNTLKGILKRNTLEDRLKEIGYILISTYKVGKYKAYDIKQSETNNSTDWDQFQTHYKIRKKDEHTKYTCKRIMPTGLTSSKSSILRDNDIDISLTTAKRYDSILENEGYIKPGDTVYMMYDSEDNSYIEITKQEYNHYWFINRYAQEQLAELKFKQRRKMITDNDYDSLRDTIVTKVANKTGTIVVKFDTYEALEKSKELIKMLADHSRVNNTKNSKEDL